MRNWIRETCTSGSAGAPGKQSPWAARPISPVYRRPVALFFTGAVLAILLCRHQRPVAAKCPSKAGNPMEIQLFFGLPKLFQCKDLELDVFCLPKPEKCLFLFDCFLSGFNLVKKEWRPVGHLNLSPKRRTPNGKPNCPSPPNTNRNAEGRAPDTKRLAEAQDKTFRSPLSYSTVNTRLVPSCPRHLTTQSSAISSEFTANVMSLIDGHPSYCTVDSQLSPMSFWNHTVASRRQ